MIHAKEKTEGRFKGQNIRRASLNRGSGVVPRIWGHVSRDLDKVRKPCGYQRERNSRDKEQ